MPSIALDVTDAFTIPCGTSISKVKFIDYFRLIIYHMLITLLIFVEHAFDYHFFLFFMWLPFLRVGPRVIVISAIFGAH